MPKKREKKSASPYSTGGGGVRFEHRVGAVYLAKLLTNRAVSPLGDRAPTSIAFQQSPRTPVDDLVVSASGDDGTVLARLEIAIRRAPKFVVSDEATMSLVRALVKADLAIERSPDEKTEVRLAVAVSGQQTHAKELAELAAVARNQPSAKDFFELVLTPGKFASSARLEQLLGMVTTALQKLEELFVADPRHRCWRLLQRLRIITLDVEAENPSDWTALLDELSPVARDHSSNGARELRGQLDVLAGEFARTAGVITQPMLRRKLHGAIDPAATTPPPGWDQLMSLDRDARSAVSQSLATPGTADGLTLRRKSARDALGAALKPDTDLFVTGDSGVGKSALVLNVLAHDRAKPDIDAIAINLRHLPADNLTFLSLLQSPLEHLFAWLTAPDRILVIDAAEACAEDHDGVFVSLLRSARAARLKVVVIAATEGAAVARELANRGAEPLEEHVVSGLRDDEIASLAQRIPALQRLAENERSRELLRRPIVVDLLLRLGTPSLPLSEEQALAQIWRQLVRGGNPSSSGTPGEREHAMLRLAAHSLHGGYTDALLSSLDSAAVEGLRQAGLLLPASDLPWQRLPQFKHDLLRFYALARHLLDNRDPAAALMSASAPRWSLPAGRLASEILLAAPEDAVDPRAGRLTRLQAGFDKLVAAGFGERWADVPSEAVLTDSTAKRYLEDSWTALVDGEGKGIARLLRVLRTRHNPEGLIDVFIAEPLVELTLQRSFPPNLDGVVTELRRDWLRSHVFRGTPDGHPARVAIRERILRECATKDAAAERERLAEQEALDARTQEEVAAEEERNKSVIALWNALDRRRRTRPERARSRPYLRVAGPEIEQLALLGRDLNDAGEAILRRIAEDDPQRIHHAVEPFLAASGLASYDSSLLADLTAAYYIEDDDSWFSGRPGENGIRDHRVGPSLTTPPSHLTYGPFLALLRSNYREGVALINRLVNHAAVYRMQNLARSGNDTPPPEFAAEFSHTLAISGEERRYIGDANVWLWYRGTGVGPYPCQSALQALEFVTEELIESGVPIPTALGILLNGAESLAVPAVALAVIVRHLEAAGDAIDPYLTEPLLWELEVHRAVQEQMGLAAGAAQLKNLDRRRWCLADVSTNLTLRANTKRAAQLKALGAELLKKASARAGGSASSNDQRELAVVKQWAAFLDRDAYEVTRTDDRVLVEISADPETRRVLNATDEGLQSYQDALGLVVRHGHPRKKGGPAPELGPDQLISDLAVARRITDECAAPGMGALSEGPAAVAASALELHLSGRSIQDLGDVCWGAEHLLRVAAEFGALSDVGSSRSFSSDGPDCLAGRALPYLLLPDAAQIRRQLLRNGQETSEELLAPVRALALNAPQETRIALAQGLDVIWATHCDRSDFGGKCHHDIAFDWMQESFAYSVVGKWDPHLRRFLAVRLDSNASTPFANVKPEHILPSQLPPAIRAFGTAAIHQHCATHRARESLDSLVDAHRRGTLAHEHGQHRDHNDALIVARSQLQQASDGRDEGVLRYIEGYLGRPHRLSQALRAVAAAGEESETLARHAQRLWPRLMDRVLDAAKEDANILAERTWGEFVVTSLIPSPADIYITREVAAPIRWPRPLEWPAQMERWIEQVPASRRALDMLVAAVYEMNLADQVATGLKWVWQLVAKSDGECVGTITLPGWLRERRPDIKGEEPLAQWQRVVDRLVVAGESRVSDLAD